MFGPHSKLQKSKSLERDWNSKKKIKWHNVLRFKVHKDGTHDLQIGCMNRNLKAQRKRLKVETLERKNNMMIMV